MAMPNPQNRHLSTVESNAGEIMDEVIAKGDLKQLSPEQRAAYYTNVCKSMGLNPFTKPFEYITLNNKLTLYATRTAADQLRKINGVSITAIERDIVDDLIVVTVRVQDSTGRTDEEVGAVSFGGLKGDAKANAIMKAITKAKRRATLSICGLGWLDETEVDSVPSARPANVDVTTGEIKDTAPQQRATSATAEVVDDNSEALAQVLDTAEHIGLDREVLDVMANIGGFASINDMPTDRIRSINTFIQSEDFDSYYADRIAPRLEDEEEDE